MRYAGGLLVVIAMHASRGLFVARSAIRSLGGAGECRASNNLNRSLGDSITRVVSKSAMTGSSKLLCPSQNICADEQAGFERVGSF